MVKVPYYVLRCLYWIAFLLADVPANVWRESIYRRIEWALSDTVILYPSLLRTAGDREQWTPHLVCKSFQNETQIRVRYALRYEILTDFYLFSGISHFALAQIHIYHWAEQKAGQPIRGYWQFDGKRARVVFVHTETGHWYDHTCDLLSLLLSFSNAGIWKWNESGQQWIDRAFDLATFNFRKCWHDVCYARLKHVYI